MIPTMIVFGLVLGRWWRSALVAGAVGWAVLLLSTGVIDLAGVPGAMLFGLVNTGVGVGVHQAVRHLLRRGRTAAASPLA